MIGKYKTPLLIGGLIVVFFIISLIFRIKLPYNSVFTGGWIKFNSSDAYWHMRLVDNLVHNFPHLTHFDPYFIYPGGTTYSGPHFFNWLVALIIWIVGLGSPSQHMVDVISAYYPAILGALTVIPVYFIGKALFNRWVGVMASFLVAIFPGEFLGRSILGFTDYNVAETLFSTVAVLFLILAIKEAGQRQLTLSHFIHRDWEAIRRPLIYSLLSGFFLGIYLITWQGALLFVFIISLYFVIQFIINHLRHKSPDHLGIVGFFLFLIAAIIFLPTSPGRALSYALVVALFIPPVLAGTSWLISSKGLKRFYYPLTLVVIGAIFTALFYAVAPGSFHALWNDFSFVFFPSGSTAQTTMEMQHFLSPSGTFSTLIAWGNFTSSFFLFKGAAIPGFGLISLVIMIVLACKQRGSPEINIFFIIWSIIILIITLIQRRFAYYLVVNLAVLSAYISYQIIWYAGLRRVKERAAQVAEQKAEASKVKGKRNPSSAAKTCFFITWGQSRRYWLSFSV